jgi:uncharacterized protein YbjT (DUF2867 family)
MTNLLANAETVKHTGRLFAPAGKAEIAYVDPRDVAAVAAATLATDCHVGRMYRVTGPAAITFEQIARDLSAATARRVEYVNVPDEAARQAMLEAGLPAMMAYASVDVFASFRAGTMTRITNTVEAVTGRTARTFGQFARDHAALFGTDVVEPAVRAVR